MKPKITKTSEISIDDYIGNYQIKKKIGEGGFGEIYQAEHVLIGELATIKINKELTEDAADLLKLEAKILWRLNEYHSIPSTKDFIKISDKQYALVLNYIDGETLDQMVERNISKGVHIHAEDACWITERLLGALYYCHYNGVVHGDVKPENVFIEPKKRDIKLIDFGLATYKPSAASKPIGYTERYAAPELRDGKPPIPESDIYGAGIVMLCALGGNVDSKKMPGSVPKEVKDYCNKLLSYDPTNRPSWDNDNPLIMLSDVRYSAFGRRHLSDK